MASTQGQKGRNGSKKASSSSQATAKTSARSTVGGPARRSAAKGDGASDPLLARLEATEALAGAIPYNKSKKLEYGEAVRPPSRGETSEPSDRAATGSTLTETNRSNKVGSAAKPGENPTNAPLDRVRVDSGGQTLTTNQGVPVADNQSTLKAGLRGPA